MYIYLSICLSLCVWEVCVCVCVCVYISYIQICICLYIDNPDLSQVGVGISGQEGMQAVNSAEICMYLYIYIYIYVYLYIDR